MSVISKKNSFLQRSSAALLVVFVTLLSLLPSSQASIIITADEAKCLEATGELFLNAGQDLKDAKDEFQVALEMEMTSAEKMSARYPADLLHTYDSYCTKYGGKMHIITIDFFDCMLLTSDVDVELTLKNFANCMAPIQECAGFNQEHILQEAWAELGLNCVLEEEETKKDPPKGKDTIDDDIAKKEKEAAAGGADEADQEEKNAEYIPKEEIGKDGKRKKKFGFFKFVLFLSLCGVGYYVLDRYRKGYPIELPYAISSRLPFGFGGSAPSRFARRPQTGFVSDYNLIGGEENTLQFSTELA